MDDDEAFMQLVLSNAQGELSPLERGIHCFLYVEKAKAGRPRKGDEGIKRGLSAYAERVGITKQYAAMLSKAGEVAQIVNLSCRFTGGVWDALNFR